jgi:hypothetical protein
LVIAAERGIPVEVEKELVDEAWCRKAKGLKQVLFERGWINPDVPHNRYTMKGKREDLDETGNLNKEGKNYCLPYLLNQCKASVKKRRISNTWSKNWAWNSTLIACFVFYLRELSYFQQID